MDMIEYIEDINLFAKYIANNMSNVIMTDQPAFLFDSKEKRVLPDGETSKDAKFYQMSLHPFNDLDELIGLFGKELVVVQNGSLKKSPWDFCKYLIRFVKIN